MLQVNKKEEDEEIFWPPTSEAKLFETKLKQQNTFSKLNKGKLVLSYPKSRAVTTL